MSKKKRKMPKNNVVWQQSVEEVTLAKMPRYNGYVCGYGAHGDIKYNRKKAKRTLNRQLKQEGASWGSFRFDSGLPNTFTGLYLSKKWKHSTTRKTITAHRIGKPRRILQCCYTSLSCESGD